jgi:hypothetical protein
VAASCVTPSSAEAADSTAGDLQHGMARESVSKATVSNDARKARSGTHGGVATAWRRRSSAVAA